jgi:lambda family phage portal protein
MQAISGSMTALAAFPSSAWRSLSETAFNMVASVRCGMLALSNPRAALVYRTELEHYLSYSAASRKGPNKNWRPSNKTADEQIMRGWSDVMARARDLVRNNPNISGALRKICNNVVFKGIMPQAQLMRGDVADEANNRLIEHQFKKWARQVKFRSKQKQVVRSMWSDGGSFVHCFASETLHKRGVVPMGIEILEVDHLDRDRNEELENGHVINRGIEYTPDGFVAAYWLFPNHPGNTRNFMRRMHQSQRVPADTCFLIMDPERPSQSLPIPLLASVIMSMHNFNEYQDAEQIAARIGAAFSVFVKTTSGGIVGNTLSGAPMATLAEGGTTEGGTVPGFVGSGNIIELPPGKEIQVANNPRPGENYADFVRTSLRNASTGVGMSSSAFSNDYSDANYSSIRQSVLEERRSYQDQQQLLKDEMLDPVFELWVMYRWLFGYGQEREIPVVWQTPGWEWVDPLKDATAAKLLKEMGIENEIDLAASRGRDYEENVEKQARAKEMRKRKGLDTEQEATPNA